MSSNIFLFMSEVILSDIEKKDVVENILDKHGKLFGFIRSNRRRCYIVTNNQDVYISEVLRLLGIGTNIMDPHSRINLTSPVVAIGSSGDDIKVLQDAAIAIGYGGINEISDTLLNHVSYAIYEEEKLCRFLERLL